MDYPTTLVFQQPPLEEQIFDEEELVILFAAIIRQAQSKKHVPLMPASEALFALIKASAIEPNWEDLPLPGGMLLGMSLINVS